MNDGNAKQQIVDNIKKSTNILVTVSNDPSVDELSAALGLTSLLNKMNKHATAVVSGAIPPAITFLDPEKTFENTVDSLRDFIIALDKSKADHLRYKVEGEVVKIFITPYRTTISDNDLEFSQGDYNVELVLALGVKERDNLDKALAAHGRILHDAAVVTMSAGEASSLGSIDWHESNASSLSEMLVSLSDSLKEDADLLDEQIATAFLTGIVASTDRFSNNKTSSKVMTIAAQLMAAGANQQLIAAKLEDANEISSPAAPKPKAAEVTAEPAHADGTTDLSEGQSTKVGRSQSKKTAPLPPPKKDDGSLIIEHGVDAAIEAAATETATRQQEEAAEQAEETLAQQLPTVAPTTAPLADLEKDLTEAAAETPELPKIVTKPQPTLAGAVSDEAWKTAQTPSMGGTLNATTEQAADDQRKVEEDDRNRTILTHSNGDYISNDDAPSFQSPLNAANGPSDEAVVPDVFAAPPNASEVAPMQYEETPAPNPQSMVTLADIDEKNRQPHNDARAAVEAAFGAVPFTPTPAPEPAPDNQPVDTAPAPVVTPPMPDFSTLPPLPPAPSLPPEKLEDVLPAPAAPAPAPGPSDPAQFKIPGQQ
ncbi:MAG TPA: hypothetical protein VF281_03945 [Candidatus Saccharimonadales bacterium]